MGRVVSVRVLTRASCLWSELPLVRVVRNSYLSDRMQQVRLGSLANSWKLIIKGVPQGSILGPLLFNVLINDIFFSLLNTLLFIITQTTILYLLFTKIAFKKKKVLSY